MSHRSRAHKHNGTPVLGPQARHADPAREYADAIGKLPLREQAVALGLALRCTGCGQAATMKVTMHAPAADFVKRWPELAAVLMFRNEGALPAVQTVNGPMVPFSIVGACQRCRKNLEIEAAKAPDWCWAKIDEIRVDDAPQVSVPERVS